MFGQDVGYLFSAKIFYMQGCLLNLSSIFVILEVIFQELVFARRLLNYPFLILLLLHFIGHVNMT